MLACHGCMRHCLQVLIGDGIPISARTRPNVPSSIFRPTARNFSISSYRPYKPTERPRDSNKSFKKPHSKAKPKDVTPKEIAIHLKFLRDPIKLAEFVRKTLREDNHDLAQKVVHEASSKTPCVVSWNHIMEWQLSKGKMNESLRTLNDMKRRGQVPDAQTYTIIFNGCSQHKDSTQALHKVLSLYQTMLTEKAPIRPNTIHLNAMLKMCGRAGNIEALFSIVDQMETKGLTAPNNLTYTTILNALRYDAVSKKRSLQSPAQLEKSRQETILHARHIWTAVVKAWRKGDVFIDEELVCSMGRVLLIGTEQDLDDVLSLVEQTMNIPRLVPRMGTPERIGPALRVQDLVEAQAISSPASDTAVEKVQDDELESILPVVFSSNISPVYATPGHNTFSLALQSLTDASLKETATKYWNLFIKTLNIIPDAENYHSYLRILRLSRSSTETVTTLLQMPPSYLQDKTFRIAMSTCLRDKTNQHSFANAGKVLDLMQSTLKEPDIMALHSYLELAITCGPQYSPKMGITHAASKLEKGKQILRALDRLGPSMINLKSALQFSDPTSYARSTSEQADFRTAILNFTKRKISAYDILLASDMAPPERHSYLVGERAKLSAFVNKQKAHMYREPDKRMSRSKPIYAEVESETQSRPRFTITREGQGQPVQRQRHSEAPRRTQY